MSRKQRRAERFRTLQDDTCDAVALARQDMRTLDSWEFEDYTPKLKWTTPEWAKPERYKVVDFDSGDQFIVRPLRPNNDPPVWECVRNAGVVQLVTGDIYKACIWMERNLL